MDNARGGRSKCERAAVHRFPESREALWPKLMESGLWEGELRNVTRDGIPVAVSSSWTLMKDERGNASAISK